MKKLFSWFSIDLMMLGLIIGTNLFAWLSLGLAEPAPYIVTPIRDPEIVTLLEYIRSGSHSGEPWQVTLTELEAEQTITWYLHRYPQIPFSHPKVEINSEYVAGEGDATIAGLRIHVSGKAKISLKDGLPQVRILELNLPLPGPLRRTIESEIERQLKRANLLPVRFTETEWKDGEVIVHGVIR